MLFLTTCCVVAAREAYVTSVASLDIVSTPGYIYSALALINSIRRFDQERDVIILIDDVTLLAFNNTRQLFEEEGAIVVQTRLLDAATTLGANTQRNWLAAFAKLNVFQLSLMAYDTLLYMDADGIVMSAPESLFALPFTATIEAYGMRDHYGCHVQDNIDKFMSALFVWTTRGRRQIDLSARVTEALINAAALKRRFSGGDQQILGEIFGSRLALLDETVATNILRCSCKKEGTGVRSLRTSIYAHFMSTMIDVNHASTLVLEGKSIQWDKSTVFNSHESDCAGYAYNRWQSSLKNALAHQRQSVALAADRNFCSAMRVRAGVCAPFVATSIMHANNSLAILDNDMTTSFIAPHGAGDEDFLTLTLPYDSPRIEYFTLIATSDGRTLHNNEHYVLSIDGRRLDERGRYYGRPRSVRVNFMKYVPGPLRIRELVMQPMNALQVEYLRFDADRTRSPPWHPAPENVGKEHALEKMVDGDFGSTAHISNPWNGFGVSVSSDHVVVVCGFDILTGTNDGDDGGDSLRGARFYVNDGQVELPPKSDAGKARHAVQLPRPLKVFNFAIEFANHTQWLMIREVLLTPPFSVGERMCAVD